MKKVNELVTVFEKFMSEEISSAVKELENITQERNRKHLQRLVYTNLVNRFDVLIDNLILAFSTQDEGNFKSLVLDKVKEETLSMKDFLEILSSSNSKEKVVEKIEDIVRLNFLRERHSKKLRVLLRYCLDCPDGDLDRARVNVGDGRIHAVYNKKHKTIPRSIIGYSDYLYSKRNVLVHGESTSSSMLDLDVKYLRKAFNVTPSKYISLKLSAIETTSVFYSYICKFIKSGKWPEKRGF